MTANALSEREPQASWPLHSNLDTTRFFFLAAGLLGALSLPGLFSAGSNSGHAIGVYSLRWAGLLGICIAVTLGLWVLFALLFTPTRPRLARLEAAVSAFLVRLGALNLLAACGVGLGCIGLVYWRFQNQLNGPVSRLWLFWLASGLAGFFLQQFWRKLDYFWAILGAASVLGLAARILGYLPTITSDPFTLAWSEASRFYYASLPYARQIYGIPIPLSPWHASRYLILGLPFLISNLPLWFHRFWQVFLWISLSLGTGWVLARHFHIQRLPAILACAAWAALFLQQGPVYYHLLVCVLLTLWGFDAQRFWKTLLFVSLASIWAGISRVNWFPVPAMLAAALYLLESPFSKARSWWRYLVPPIAWGIVGGAAALAAQTVYMRVSGQVDPSLFASTYKSALLWYRLFPSPTSGIGVLPNLLIISLPLLALTAGTWWVGRRQWHPLRILGLAGMGAVLAGGGLVVSTKIGGGSNIHNLDAFITYLLVLGSAVWMKGFSPEGQESPRTWRPWLLTLLIVVLPVAWNLNIGDPFAHPDLSKANQDLKTLNAYLQGQSAKGEILFITQRQLLTFGQVSGIRTVPDYELLTLSEMSISTNTAYLDRFAADLHAHRFAAIVVDPQRDVLQTPANFGFAEENNAWVEYISRPILANYQEGLRIEGQNIDVMIPKP